MYMLCVLFSKFKVKFQLVATVCSEFAVRVGLKFGSWCVSSDSEKCSA